jgi:hypothetical protein
MTIHDTTPSLAFYITIPSRVYITIPPGFHIAEAFTINGGKTDHMARIFLRLTILKSLPTRFHTLPKGDIPIVTQ